MKSYDSIEDAIIATKSGKIVIISDDENRENEGDFFVAAQALEPEHINFMSSFGRGLICTPITQDIAQKLNLKLMVPENNSIHDTAFTVSIDLAKHQSGVSCGERTQTIKALTDPRSNEETFRKPGHVFPLIAHPNGLLKRRGHTEASIELCYLAKMVPCAVLCEIMNSCGNMANYEELSELKRKFDLIHICVADLVTYLKKTTKRNSKK